MNLLDAFIAWRIRHLERKLVSLERKLEQDKYACIFAGEPPGTVTGYGALIGGDIDRIKLTLGKLHFRKNHCS